MTPNELSSTHPLVELRCDACAEPTFLYRLLGTRDALCGDCFVRAYPSGATVERRRRPGRRRGPAAAGCLRDLRTPPGASDVHRLLGRSRA